MTDIKFMTKWIENNGWIRASLHNDDIKSIWYNPALGVAATLPNAFIISNETELLRMLYNEVDLSDINIPIDC